MKYWEIIADNLSKAGWSWGCVSAINSNGRTSQVIQMAAWRVKEGGKVRPMTREEIGEQLLHGKIVKVERP